MIKQIDCWASGKDFTEVKTCIAGISGVGL